MAKKSATENVQEVAQPGAEVVAAPIPEATPAQLLSQELRDGNIEAVRAMLGADPTLTQGLRYDEVSMLHDLVSQDPTLLLAYETSTAIVEEATRGLEQELRHFRSELRPETAKRMQAWATMLVQVMYPKS